MKKLLITIMLVLLSLSACTQKQLSEEDIIKERVNSFFNAVYDGDIDKASKYLTGDAEKFIENFDLNNILSKYLSGFNLFNVSQKTSKAILSKFFKQAIKSHELLEVRKINDSLYEVDVRLEMLDIEKIKDNISAIDITKLFGNNYGDLISIFLTGNEEKLAELIGNIMQNFNGFGNFSLNDLIGKRIITMEIEKDGEWYIKTLFKQY